MSALEPDSPSPHIWPHWRAAVRAWHTARKGRHLGRPALGEVRGKGPSTSDVLRVGRVFVRLGYLTTSGALTQPGQVAVAVAMGLGARTEHAAVIRRVERYLRADGCVRPAKAPPAIAKWPTRHQDGKIREHAYVKEQA